MNLGTVVAAAVAAGLPAAASAAVDVVPRPLKIVETGGALSVAGAPADAVKYSCDASLPAEGGDFLPSTCQICL